MLVFPISLRVSLRTLLRALCSLALATVASAQVSITSHPKAVVVPVGQPATFTVTATTTGTATYQWRRHGYALSGATQSSYTIGTVSQADNALYDVVVTSGGTATTSQPARLLATLPTYPSAFTADLSRSVRLEGPDNGYIPAQAVLPDGRYYVLGSFTSVGTQTCGNLVRLNPNGTLDSSFVAPTFDVVPTSLALQSDGKILVSGYFKNVGGIRTGGIVRLNTDGSRDNTFALGANFDGVPDGMAIASDGSIYAYGYLVLFTQGTPAIKSVLKFTSSGAVDSTFASPTFTFNSQSVQPSGMVVSPNGGIFVRGEFSQVGGLPRSKLVRLLPTGNVDPAFNPGAGADSFITSMIALSNNQLVIAGNFTAYNGTPAGHVARLSSDGSIDRTFSLTGLTSMALQLVELPNLGLFVGLLSTTVYNNQTISGLRLQANGTVSSILPSGPFYRIDVASLLPSGQLLLTGADNRFQEGVRVINANNTPGASPDLRFPARARLLAYQPGGKIILAGDFRFVNGVSTAYVTRLNADLSRDLTFLAGNGTLEQVQAGVVQPDGKIILFGLNSMLRLNADGTTDPSFSTAAHYVAPSAPTAPVVLQDGRILVATDGSVWANNDPVTTGFVLLEPNGSRATRHPLLPGPPAGARITGVQLLPDGQLLITGRFASWNGVARPNAVRLRADGSVDTSFTLDSALLDDAPIYVAPSGPSFQRDGRLIAMSTENRPIKLFRLNANGSRDPTFGGDLPDLYNAGRLLVQPDDRILMSGLKDQTVTSQGLPSIITRFDRNGTAEPTFTLSGSTFWQVALLADNGDLLTSPPAGGYLYRHTASPVPVITVQPAGQTVVAGFNTTLHITAESTAPIAYQWSKDGVAIPGATTAALSLDNISLAAAGNYAVTVSNGSGQVVSSSARIVVTARPTAGTYFGSLQNNSGSFALFLREDGTGAFLAYARTTKTVVASNEVKLDAGRHFQGTATFTPATTGSTTVDGAIGDDGTVLGQIAGLGLGFSAGAAGVPLSGLSPAFYQGAVAGSSTNAALIVGADGSAFAVITGATVDGGLGDVDSATGNFTVTTMGSGTRFTGTAPSNSALWSGTLASTGGSPLSFTGANNDQRTVTEKFVDISTRTTIATAGDSFTAGFVITGDRPKPVLIRAVGPGLSGFQVQGALSAARLEVFRGSTSIAVGGDWSSAANASLVAATAQRVGAFALAPGSRDAALLLTLDPGAYSAAVSGQNGAIGVALAEVYDATEGPVARNQRIVNISTLARAGANDAVLVAGFVIDGLVPKRVLVRGAGPALVAFGVQSALTKPKVAIYSGSTVLAQNTGWSTSPDAAALAAAATQVGAFAFPAGSQDSALIINLLPGPYTAQVSAADSVPGTALVEIYELP